MIDDDYSQRHVEVLEAALALIAERGVAGGSLRELARRLGMSQPSLYHYFTSKDELIEQLVSWAGSNMIRPPSFAAQLPEGLDEMPALMARIIFDLYERDARHINFVRFMFAVSLERPDLRPRLQLFFGEQVTMAIDMVMSRWVSRGELTVEEGRHLTFMVTRALGLAFIEQYVLSADPDRDELVRYARFVVEAAVHTIRARRPVVQPELPERDTDAT